MQKVFDYAGNEIKEGDEVAMIKIIKRHYRVGFVITGKEIWNDKKPDGECFEIGAYHKVIVRDETVNELGYVVEISMTGGGTATCYSTLEIMQVFDMEEGVILGIKGISDTKEYYDTWKAAQKILT